jgi:Excalibur calcium-binding domain
LPPNKSYRCTYVSRIVDVKSIYGLWVTQTEHDAIAAILTNCNSTASAPAPATPTTTGADTEPGGTPPVSVQPTIPVETPESVPPPAPATEVAASVYYPDCNAAKAAGAAPLYVGQPGDRPGLDRDGDGIACES